MGNQKSSKIPKSELTDELLIIVNSLFLEFDQDRSWSIDKIKALKFWAEKFPKMNTEQFLKEEDEKDWGIEHDEWIDFWKMVKGTGYTEDEIIEILINLKDDRAWIDLTVSTECY